MAYQLMGHTAVNGEPTGNRAVLQHTLVTALNDTGDELIGGAIANLALGLVASPAGALNLTQQGLGGRAILDVGLLKNNLYCHYSSPPFSVSNCPA